MPSLTLRMMAVWIGPVRRGRAGPGRCRAGGSDRSAGEVALSPVGPSRWANHGPRFKLTFWASPTCPGSVVQSKKSRHTTNRGRGGGVISMRVERARRGLSTVRPLGDRPRVAADAGTVRVRRVEREIRICFIGDSFVQGIGDPEYRGWVGRVLEATSGQVTAFNLGIRRQTSTDVLDRCWQEVAVRMLAGADNRLVVSFGSNDMLEENAHVRVEQDRCLENLAALLDECDRRDVAALIVGPPPVVDAGDDHLRRTVALAEAMAALCRARDVPFIDVTRTLAGDSIWKAEALAGDGAHPGPGGYQRLAELVLAGQWHAWISRPARSPSGTASGAAAS